ncbi:MAG: secretion system protein E [Candidatus Omnitrophica bacterium CG11_big_fil_rev_8_21_14_0_20_41_12]|nr:MAG: secretion system protein E [Candidatus Omnitrophica bacterium CG11_big_fil_rev_8_21_14_0_20_41_12]
MHSLRENIIEILLKSNHITKEQLDRALSLQKEKEMPLRKVLIDEGIITEEILLSLFSEQLYLPSLRLAKFRFDTEIVNLIPEQMAKLYNTIPLSKIGNTLTVAMSDPLNIFALDDLGNFTGSKIDIVVSPEDEINRAIDSQYRKEVKEMQSVLDEVTLGHVGDLEKNLELVKADAIELSGTLQDSQKAPIVQLVDIILAQALKRRASDIHIEPEIDCLRIRYRVDGSLHDILKVPKINQNAILARLKIISNLDITENRIPQDGRFKVRTEGREIDFRVSSLPTTFGQKFVLRALDKGNLSIGLDKLGFSEQPDTNFKKAVAKPFGMMLVTGPTGSGKSTTLYSVLNQLNTPEKNIITIEDPVEYQVDGITQMQVKPDIGLDFASGLRSILRQSPDVIMIGEIRDAETADIAIKAALTGQLVLSTLHTNDAISSITRLIDMGVEPFLVASSVIMLCAQRLARKICLKCRKPIEVPEDFLKQIGFSSGKTTFYAAQGCKYCNNTGFYGRVAVLETLLIDDNIREMIIRRNSLDEIKAYAIKKLGMKTLRDDAFLKVREEQTTLDEAIRITTEE